MAKLVIRGHATRGKEVIEILEMLGGRNLLLQQGCGKGIYLIDTSKHIIIYINEKDIIDKFIVFTLEEFLEKFPYKVGDKIDLNGDEVDITGLYWNGTANEINYEEISVKLGREYDCISVKDMKPYTEQKEETMEETKKDLDWHPTDYLEFVDNDEWAEEVELNLGDSYEILLKDGKYYAVKKKPQYPKTYEECCDILRIPNDERYIDIDVLLSYNDLLKSFIQLLVCRDAYWKVAGDWKETKGKKLMHYVIYSTLLCEVIKDCQPNGIANFLLDFPTKEMRDAFYENFKELIERCKELL